jgi:PhnB protein
MLIPHLHFCGDCADAIRLYETAFDTKSETIIKISDESPDAANGDEISHAVMNIHGVKIFLNDRFGNKNRTTDVAVHLIVVFDSTAALLSCYEIMKPGSTIVDPMMELPYSALAVQFLDRFGVQWGFMVKEDTVK